LANIKTKKKTKAYMLSNYLRYMVNVEISEFVKAKLEAIKREEGHKSLDSVVRSLLERNKK